MKIENYMLNHVFSMQISGLDNNILNTYTKIFETNIQNTKMSKEEISNSWTNFMYGKITAITFNIMITGFYKNKEYEGVLIDVDLIKYNVFNKQIAKPEEFIKNGLILEKDIMNFYTLKQLYSNILLKPFSSYIEKSYKEISNIPYLESILENITQYLVESAKNIQPQKLDIVDNLSIFKPKCILQSSEKLH